MLAGPLLDHLIRPHEHRQGDHEPERFGGLEGGPIIRGIFAVTPEGLVVWECVNPYFFAEPGRPGINNGVVRAFRYTPEEVERARRA